jgi:hypothetical protein
MPDGMVATGLSLVFGHHNLQIILNQFLEQTDLMGSSLIGFDG